MFFLWFFSIISLNFYMYVFRRWVCIKILNRRIGVHFLVHIFSILDIVLVPSPRLLQYDQVLDLNDRGFWFICVTRLESFKPFWRFGVLSIVGYLPFICWIWCHFRNRNGSWLVWRRVKLYRVRLIRFEMQVRANCSHLFHLLIVLGKWLVIHSWRLFFRLLL